MLDESKFEWFSYSSSNWVVKQHRQLLTSTTNAFGLGTAKERTAQQWFKKFCKGDKSLEDEALSGRPLEVDSDQQRAIIEAYPLTATWEVAEELNIEHSVVIWHLKQIGKVKKLVKWVLHEQTENF